MSDTTLWYAKYYQDLIDFMQQEGSLLSKWGEVIEQQLFEEYVTNAHGDMARWQAAYESLPDIDVTEALLNQSAIEVRHPELSAPVEQQVHSGLKNLMPWRKGPFQFFDTHIDTEWRSDFKWDRIKDHISPLHGRTVLDVGCGSGYHMWRMLGEGASRVIGVDPSKLFFWQFEAVKKYVQTTSEFPVPVHLLPFKMEDVPAKLKRFDTVFSMGVLYHRRSPLDHLTELQQALRPGGELVLETLVIEGKEGEVLVPDDRYAMMRNVWFLPSVPTLCQWLRRLGFKDVRMVEQNYTSQDEQRSTDWMGFSSLKDFLDPHEPTKTVEGLPAPLRATIVATA